VGLILSDTEGVILRGRKWKAEKHRKCRRHVKGEGGNDRNVGDKSK
jgi:hypothetical protein